MELSRKICILLSVAVLMQLVAGCRAAEVSPGPDATPLSSQGQREDREPSARPESAGPEASSAQPAPEPDLWDPEHTLGIPFTPADGLELPVAGATGYASVKLPLWGSLPSGNEGKLATIYAPPRPAPDPAVEAAASPDPAPGPEETEPAPSESAEVQPDPPEETAGPAQGAEDAVPSESPEGEAAVPPEVSEPAVEPSAEPMPSPAPEPTSEPVPEPAPEPEPTPVPNPMAGAALVLEPGTAFRILGESGSWWQVSCKGVTGWVEHRYCLINLPDVIPSMIYDDTNAYSSAFASGGKDIPNITGRVLYQAEEENPRLGRREYLMPVLYSTAKNVCRAQQNALAEGNTLVLYEGFRPYETQMSVVRGLTALSRRDEAVRAGISSKPWNISWFIATGASNHQEGYAVDVGLAKVTRAHTAKIGSFSVIQVDEYQEYPMPTPIHELSMAAAVFTQPAAMFSTTAWRSADLTPAFAGSEPAQALQRCCTSAGLTPLASSWWHFNDLAAYGQIRAYPSGGNYRITQCLSVVPE